MPLQDWSTATSDALMDAWARIVNFLPNLIGAIIIIIIGDIVANILKWVVVRLVEASGLERWFKSLKFADALQQANMTTDLSKILGEFVKWVTIILFLLPAAAVLGLPQVSAILNQIISYLPHVGSAVIILFLGALFAEFLGNVVKATAAGLGATLANGLATASRYAIYVFAGLSAIAQLGIAPQIINILITGFVAALAIASGLAFGLGGKDAASDLIAKVRRDFAQNQK